MVVTNTTHEASNRGDTHNVPGGVPVRHIRLCIRVHYNRVSGIFYGTFRN